LFHSYGPFTGSGEDAQDPADVAPDLDKFLAEAELEGAVMLHVDALTAVSEAVAVYAGGPWDGALRCLQTASIAAVQRDPQLPLPDVELKRQREDLALVAAAGRDDLSRIAADMRARAQADALDWKQVTEQLDLLHD
jgi:hypothetical protein